MAVESLKTLRRRVRTVRNIKQITRAMEMVSAAKLRRAQATLLAARPYARKLQDLLARVAASSTVAGNPLFHERPGKRRVLVVFTSDRGLAGSFNVNIARTAEEQMRSEPDAQWRLICIGRRGRDYFTRRGYDVIDSVVGLGGQADSQQATRLADRLREMFLAGEADTIDLLYARFISTVVNRPMVVQFLPMTPEALQIGKKKEPAIAAHETEYIIEPSPQAVFDQLLPRYLSSRVYITMAEQATSEHSARMVSMNNATKNCTELGDQLTLKLNKARQGAITKELLDIVGGAEALQKG
ncbi:ATP synthase F1 subunit gamma [bacterium]|nr:ATP synthase F1 subunit gamma [bacterium]